MIKIGFIGAGNMGFAMMKGAIQKFGKDSIAFTDASMERMEMVRQELDIPYALSNLDCLSQSEIIVLAVKPQYYDDVLNDFLNVQGNNKIFISIAPGIKINYLKEKLGSATKIVRAMPNTPAMVLAGMSALSFSEDDFTVEDKNNIFEFFNSFGETVELNEKQMDMVVPISGSAPAYVFMLIEAMADAGVLCGLPRAIAYQMAAQTVMGSAKMVLETKEHPGVLKDAVCSPGGTTIEAVRKLEETGFRSSIIEAMKVCYDKTLSFSK